MLYGDKGTGKTRISQLVAFLLKASLIDNYALDIPNRDINTIYNKLGPKHGKSVVIVFNEFDVMTRRICNGAVNRVVKCWATDIYSESGLNNFMDSLEKLPNTIVIITTNIFPPQNVYQEGFFRKYQVTRNAENDTGLTLRIFEQLEQDQQCRIQDFQTCSETELDNDGQFIRNFYERTLRPGRIRQIWNVRTHIIPGHYEMIPYDT